jgi:hypothetical protein
MLKEIGVETEINMYLLVSYFYGTKFCINITN